MAISVTRLREKMTGGGARPSLFFANINMSSIKPALDNVSREVLEDAKTLSFFMKGAQIPDSTLQPIPINFLGREFKVPSTDRTFQDWTVTVINDEDFRIRHVFEAWVEYMTPGKAIFASAKAFGGEGDIENSIFCDMSVHQMAKSGGPVKYENGSTEQYLGSYFFKDAFPTSVSQIDLNWDQKDVIEEFQVTFAYQYWEKLPFQEAKNQGVDDNPFTADETKSWVAAMGGKMARAEDTAS
mgnify:CR=1 FL=1